MSPSSSGKKVNKYRKGPSKTMPQESMGDQPAEVVESEPKDEEVKPERRRKRKNKKGTKDQKVKAARHEVVHLDLEDEGAAQPNEPVTAEEQEVPSPTHAEPDNEKEEKEKARKEAYARAKDTMHSGNEIWVLSG